jgi:hypothetical protein
MAPFALAALALQFLPVIFPAPAGNLADPARVWTGWKSPLELNEEDYRKHAAFQQAFSYTSLGGEGDPYLRYSLAGDGLIDGNGAGKAVFAEPVEIPPFPLASLIDFLDNYAYTDTSPVLPRGGEFICPLILLGLWVSLILRDRQRRRLRGILSMYVDKRIAA